MRFHKSSKNRDAGEPLNANDGAGSGRPGAPPAAPDEDPRVTAARAEFARMRAEMERTMALLERRKIAAERAAAGLPPEPEPEPEFEPAPSPAPAIDAPAFVAPGDDSPAWAREDVFSPSKPWIHGVLAGVAAIVLGAAVVALALRGPWSDTPHAGDDGATAARPRVATARTPVTAPQDETVALAARTPEDAPAAPVETAAPATPGAPVPEEVAAADAALRQDEPVIEAAASEPAAAPAASVESAADPTPAAPAPPGLGAPDDTAPEVAAATPPEATPDAGAEPAPVESLGAAVGDETIAGNDAQDDDASVGDSPAADEATPAPSGAAPATPEVPEIPETPETPATPEDAPADVADATEASAAAALGPAEEDDADTAAVDPDVTEAAAAPGAAPGAAPDAQPGPDQADPTPAAAPATDAEQAAADISEAQTLLTGMGYGPGDVTGSIGPLTTIALEDFAAQFGLDGAVLTPERLETIRTAAADGHRAIRSRNNPGLARVTAIRTAQTLLAQMGYDPGPADGSAGALTVAAAEAFATAMETEFESFSPAFVEVLAEGFEDGHVADAATADDPDAAQRALVRSAQLLLADMGYAPGPADGSLGPRTEEAAAAFVVDRDLEALEWTPAFVAALRTASEDGHEADER